MDSEIRRLKELCELSARRVWCGELWRADQFADEAEMSECLRCDLESAV